jgi:hypothetical protein
LISFSEIKREQRETSGKIINLIRNRALVLFNDGSKVVNKIIMKLFTFSDF